MSKPGDPIATPGYAVPRLDAPSRLDDQPRGEPTP